MKPVVLCYEKCTICKKALKWVEDSGYALQVRPNKGENPTAAELKEWHEMSGEAQYQLLSTDGMLVKRPLLITKKGKTIEIAMRIFPSGFMIIIHSCQSLRIWAEAQYLQYELRLLLSTSVIDF